MSWKKIAFGFLGAVVLFLIYTIFITEKGIQSLKPKSKFEERNYEKLAEDASKDLQAYLRIKTVRGNEKQAVMFLKGLFDKRGIKTTIFEVPSKPERASIMAEIKGIDSEGGLILTSHVDVVEADPNEWVEHPFSGVRKGDRIYGRGAIDVKGLGIMELYAFFLIHDSGIKLKKNLMYLAVSDEESRSEFGMRFLIAKHRDIFNGYEFVHNEGGVGTKDVVVKGSKIFNVQHAEKGAIWLDLESEDISGHGSTPPIQYAALNLIDFLTDLKKMNEVVIIKDETASFFYQMGEVSPFPNSFVLKRSRNPLLAMILNGVIRSNKHLRAMTSNSVSITGIDTHRTGINVITSKVDGTVDIRILPGFNKNEIFEKVKKLGEKYNVRVVARHLEAGTISPVDSKYFKILSSVVQQVVPGAIVTPFLSPGTTDSSYLRMIGFKCYGLIPALMSSEEIDGIHGKNESITVEHLKTGIEILHKTIIEFNNVSD
ncbi:M20/M25/M40 family metallo-hydrolase [Leptospira mayottensis]|uniref:Peptidase dimerization domain protein n=2 Tax=Leptospira mayottensis TaxID=1137606 RepID=A0AA87MNJ8_9LEPT|nr:M20/M25/M40 family metallo-hydrolase [Leptospira mayottensis]AXR63757.1 M20/M25/M40 family metallo-hydrolase [Leptospira mayottensis]EKR99632.1 peptidase dimerization domain protein [Leptospira mayottensis 200901122]